MKSRFTKKIIHGGVEIKPDFFFLPYINPDEHIIYAPLREFVAVINTDAKNAIIKRLNNHTLHESEQGIIDAFEKRGFFNDELYKMPLVDEEFAPTRVTLFPADSCNLRCRYCYASAENGGNMMSIDTARAAIDLIAENTKRKKYDLFSVGFHGNGEPFTAFEIVQECCDYIEHVGERDGLKYIITTATNGVLPDEALDYLIAWISDANVSSDILPDIQNNQRPLANGGKSFDAVDNTLKRLDKAGVQYGIRATITQESVSRLREMASFVKENYPKCKLLHLEPVFEVGRALTNHQVMPDPYIFVMEFLKAQEELSGTEIRLVYSGDRQETLCQCFCSVCSNNFTVTAEGNITSCYEICTYKDPRAYKFIYGHFNKERGSFDFEKKVLDTLLELQVKNIPFCKDCFCKWHCGGDCVAKVLGSNPVSEHRGSARCVINRALTYRRILQKLGVDTVNTEPKFI